MAIRLASADCPDCEGCGIRLEVTLPEQFDGPAPPPGVNETPCACVRTWRLCPDCADGVPAAGEGEDPRAGIAAGCSIAFFPLFLAAIALGILVSPQAGVLTLLVGLVLGGFAFRVGTVRERARQDAALDADRLEANHRLRDALEGAHLILLKVEGEAP
jgi:hypothetical protein